MWYVVGDFNLIICPKERNRGGSLNLDMKRFIELIKDLELEDMPLLGAPFTWSGGRGKQLVNVKVGSFFSE